MKFLGSSVPAVEFNIVLGNKQGGFVYEDTLKTLVHIDNSIETVDFGSRKERTSSLKLVQIGESNYHTLKDYLLDNAGQKIQIEQLAGEEIFGPTITGTYYAYLGPVKLSGEQGFNSGYELELTLSYSGVSSGDEINTSSTMDFLIEAEINAIGIINNVALITDLAAISTPSEGDTTYIAENKRIYYYDASAWTLIDKSVNLKQKILNDPDLGLQHGVFRWASFSTATLQEAYYNRYVSQNATIGNTAGFATVHTGDEDTGTRGGVTIRQSDGTILVVGSSGSPVINNGASLCLRFDAGSTTPDATTTIRATSGGYYVKGIHYNDVYDNWVAYLPNSSTNLGEIYYSDDDGATWTETASSVNTKLSGIIQDTSGNMVVIGQSYKQVNLYASLDQGVTWRSQADIVTTSTSPITSIRTGLVYNDSEDAVYFFVKGQGIYKSNDLCATNTLICEQSEITALAEVNEIIKTEENYQDTFYICCSGASLVTYIYKSVDNCQTWTEVITKTGVGSGEFESAVKDNNGNIYVFLERFSGVYYTDVYKSASGADNFEKIGTNTGKRIDQSVLNLSTGIIYSSYADTSAPKEPTFETITVSENQLNVNNTFKTGIINKKSVRFPNSNIDILDGPNVETPQGFKFSLDNSDRLHIALNKYNFFGAKVRVYVYDNTGGADQKVLIRSGINKNNSLDYFNYTFEVEPDYFYNKSFTLPDKTLEGSNLTSISGTVGEKLKSENLPLTYGRWSYAKIQSVVNDDKQQELFISATQKATYFYVSDVDETSNTLYQIISTNISSSGNDDFIKVSNKTYVNVVYAGGGATGSTKLGNLLIKSGGIIKLYIPIGTKIADLQAGDKIELITKALRFALDEVKCKGFLEEQRAPKVYYFDSDLDKYIVYSGGLFIPVNDETGIEKTTQLEVNVATYNNGISTLEDKNLTLYEKHTDSLDQEIVTFVTEGLVEAEKQVSYNSLTVDSINLIYPTGGATELIQAKGTGADNGYGASGTDEEKNYIKNFGSTAITEGNTTSFRWFSINDTDLNRFSHRKFRDGLDSNQTGKLSQVEFYNKYLNLHENQKLLYNEGLACVRYFPITKSMRDNLKGADNVNLILSQVFGETTQFSSYVNNYVDGIRVIVRVIFSDNTKSVAFSDSFTNSIGDITSNNTSYISINNKPSWLDRNSVDADFTSVAGSTTLSSGLECHTGGDLITLSSALFDSTNYLFADATGLEISFTPLSTTPPTTSEAQGINFSRFFIRSFKDDSAPSIYLDTDRHKIDTRDFYLSYEKTFDIDKGVFFAKLDGGRTDIDGEIIESPIEITTDIFTKKIGKEVSFTGMDTRNRWKLRKQFFENQNIRSITQEMADNLFCSAVLKTDGSVDFKSLNLSDYSSPLFTFTDAHILKDSISRIKFKKADKIYNRFVFNFNWDWARNKYLNQVVIYLDENNVLQIEGLKESWQNALRVKYQDFFTFSKEYFGSGQNIEKQFDLKWFYDERKSSINTRDWQPEGAIGNYISKSLNYFIFNSWEFTFKIPMSYVIYNTNVTNNKIEEGDFIRLQSYFFSNNDNVDCFVKGIKPDFYNATAQISVICPEPPEIAANFYDYRWDGQTGDISGNLTDYQIKTADIWPFKDTSQVGTYPTGNTGDISSDMADYQFNDDTYADTDEDYNPFDF